MAKKRFPWAKWLIPLAILWLAFSARSSELDSQSLWVDEGISLSRARQAFPAVLSGAIPVDGSQVHDPTMPLYFVLLAGHRWLAGETVFSLRVFSVWWGVIVVALLFVSGRRLFGRVAGLAAALLGALSPYMVWYSKAARPASLFLALSLLSLLVLLRVLASAGKKPHWSHMTGLLWFAATAAMVYSQKAAWWILAFELLVIAVALFRRRVPAGMLLWAALVVLAAAPVAGAALSGLDAIAGYRPTWQEARALIVAAGTTPLLGRAAGNLWRPILRMLPAGLLVLASLLWLLGHPRRVRSWLLAAGYALVPAVAALLAALLSQTRPASHFLVAIFPAVFLLQGSGAAALWQRRRSAALVILVSAVGITGQWLYVQSRAPALAQGGLNAAAAYVSAHAQEEDVVVLHDALVRPVWDYYYSGMAPVEVVPHYGGRADAALDQLQIEGAHHRKVWLLHRPEPQGCSQPGLLLFHADQHWIKFSEHDFTSPWLSVQLNEYMAAAPVVEELPSGAIASTLCWNSGLCLRGWSASDLIPGQTASVQLYWSQITSTEDDYELTLSLNDASGYTWLQHAGRIYQYYPADRWPQGQILEQTLEIDIPAGLPPTRFLLTLSLTSVSGGYRLISTIGNIDTVVGQVTVARPERPINLDELALRYRSDATVGESLRLLGYNLPNDTPRPGHISFIDFYWQVLATPPGDWQQRTRLTDRAGQVWVEHLGPPSLPEFGVLQWRAGDLIWGRVFLPLPGQMPAGEYKVEVTLLDDESRPVPAREIWRAENRDSIAAGPAYLENWPLVTEHAPMSHQSNTIFGGTVRLWGYQVGGLARPGNELAITLVWRDELPVSDDYRVFVHLLNDADALLAQSDGVPADWTRPTSTWRPGEFIEDRHTLLIPTGAPAGPVYLWVGLYHPDGSGRVPIMQPPPGQPADRFLLDILVIEP